MSDPSIPTPPNEGPLTPIVNRAFVTDINAPATNDGLPHTAETKPLDATVPTRVNPATVKEPTGSMATPAGFEIAKASDGSGLFVAALTQADLATVDPDNFYPTEEMAMAALAGTKFLAGTMVENKHMFDAGQVVWNSLTPAEKANASVGATSSGAGLPGEGTLEVGTAGAGGVAVVDV